MLVLNRKFYPNKPENISIASFGKHNNHSRFFTFWLVSHFYCGNFPGKLFCSLAKSCKSNALTNTSAECCCFPASDVHLANPTGMPILTGEPCVMMQGHAKARRTGAREAVLHQTQVCQANTTLRWENIMIWFSNISPLCFRHFTS